MTGCRNSRESEWVDDRLAGNDMSFQFAAELCGLRPVAPARPRNALPRL